jgi:hypothetical protein
LIVSTLGDLISAMRVSAGIRATQWLGQLSDVTLQQISRDRGDIAMDKSPEPQSEVLEKFEDQYGSGHRLNARHKCSVQAK